MSSSSSLPNPVRDTLRWLLVIPAFPLSGLLVTTVIGPVDSPIPALVGGAVVGLAVGAAQLLGLRGRARVVPWLAASALGGGLGLLAGSAIVGYAITLPTLAIQGVVTGALLGLAQASALPRTARRIGWALGVAALWTIGWVTTTLIGVDVDRQYAVFGASGALVAAIGFAVLGFAVLGTVAVPASSPSTRTPPDTVPATAPVSSPVNSSISSKGSAS